MIVLHVFISHEQTIVFVYLPMSKIDIGNDKNEMHILGMFIEDTPNIYMCIYIYIHILYI